MAAPHQYQAIGRRKTSVARVYLRPGSGTQYLPTEVRQKALRAPLDLTDTAGQFDVVVNAKGGGLTGQAEATQLGIARALVAYSEDLRKPLRDAGYLTRDPRMVERKKYGQPKARKRFQFSKR
jgi:small subunit ribosomal protein S9